MLAGDKWQLTRDLALVALASYQGKREEEIDLVNIDSETQGTEETEEQL
jgi:hypothetical protein